MLNVPVHPTLKSGFTDRLCEKRSTIFLRLHSLKYPPQTHENASIIKHAMDVILVIEILIGLIWDCLAYWGANPLFIKA